MGIRSLAVRPGLVLGVLLVAAIGCAGGCAGVETSPWGLDAGDAGDRDAGGRDGGAADDAAHAGDAAQAGDAADGGPGDAGPVDGATGDAGGDAGCTVNGTTPDNCGPCGVVCPGYGEATAVVTCTPPSCGFACKGESYDCNDDPNDGCEVADQPAGYHDQASAFFLGSFNCTDSSSQQDFTGLLPTDRRTHENPTVTGFDATYGGAPDWYRIAALGGALCQDDIALTLQVSGSAAPDCFRLRAITNVSTYSCQTTAGGSCSFAPGMSSYGDGTDIYVVIDKVCAAVVPEKVTYHVTGHL